MKKNIKVELYNDHFENAKRYGIPHAQLIIADIQYNLGNNAYASNPSWYVDGDNKNGESDKANKSFFDTDKDFRINNFFDFCTRYLKKEPKEKGQAPAMIVFCAFEQMQMVIDEGKKHGLMKSYPLIFIKNYSASVLKANMKIVGATEYAVVLYRDKLPKFNNGRTEEQKGKMIFNWFEWKRDTSKEYAKIHPTQKPVGLLKRLIEIFTDEGDVVIDPVAGSASTLRACAELGRNAYGFEIKKDFYKLAKEKMPIEDLMNYMLNLFNNTAKELSEEYEKLSQKDMELSDLDHYIESRNLKAPQLAKVGRLRKTLREERRQIKNNIDTIEVIKKFTDKYNNKLITGDIIQNLKEQGVLKKRQENPTYKYRTSILDRLEAKDEI